MKQSLKHGRAKRHVDPQKIGLVVPFFKIARLPPCHARMQHRAPAHRRVFISGRHAPAICLDTAMSNAPNQKGPNTKKKQKCKNCEGKGLLKKGDKVVTCQRCKGTGLR
jgi:hypothetical protein